MKNSTRILGLVVSGLMLVMTVACGSSVVENTGGSGGSGGATGGTGGIGGDSCAGYDDQTGIGSVKLHFQNQTSQAIYVRGNCGSIIQYDLSQVGGGEDTTFWSFWGGCTQTCEERQSEGPVNCDVCAPSVIRIEPGKTVDATWNGVGLLPGVVMAAQCYAFGADPSCWRIISAPEGTWRPSAVAFSDCPADSCMCDPNGTCWGTPSGLQASSDPVTFDFPSDNEVNVVWSGCAFGCP